MPEERMDSKEIIENITQLDNWQELEQKYIEKTFNFSDFKETMNFANKIATIANDLDHHPELQIKYGEIKLRLSTHTANGLTEKDFEFAKATDKLCKDTK